MVSDDVLLNKAMVKRMAARMLMQGASEAKWRHVEFERIRWNV